MYEEYLTLISEIKHHMDLYYNEDTPEISDAEYDALMRRLKQMEKEHPDWVSADSPTQIIGGTAKRKAGVIVTHNVPMLSIEDVFTKEDVTAWIDEVRAMHPDAVFVVGTLISNTAKPIIGPPETIFAGSVRKPPASSISSL